MLGRFQPSINRCLKCQKLSVASQAKAAPKNSIDTNNLDDFCVTTYKKNGFRLASKLCGSKSTTLGLFVEAGSRWDPNQKPGVSNFLDKIIFSPKTNRNYYKEAEDRGALLHANSDKEINAYFIRVPDSKHVPWACEILLEMARNTQFDPELATTLKASILLDVNEREHDIRSKVFDYLYATAYQGTSLSQPTIGTNESVKNIQHTDLEQFIKANFKGPRIVLASAGPVEHAELIDIAAKYDCENLPIGYYDSEIGIRKPIRFSGSDLRHRDDAYPLAHVIIAVEGPKISSSDSIYLQVASALNGKWDMQLCGGNSTASKLAHAIFDSGVVRSYENFFLPHFDTSLYGIYFTSERLNLEAATEFIQGELMRIATEVTDSQVEYAKNQLKSYIHQNYDCGGTLNACETMGRQILQLSRPLSIDELLSRINDVSAGRLREIFHKYVYDKCPAVACFGPTEALLSYVRIRKNMYLLRK